MASKILSRQWWTDHDLEDASARGRLQIFKLGRSGMFSMVHEVEGLTQAEAARVPRPAEGVSEWTTLGGVRVFSSSCSITLEQFKQWRCGLCG